MLVQPPSLPPKYDSKASDETDSNQKKSVSSRQQEMSKKAYIRKLKPGKDYASKEVVIRLKKSSNKNQIKQINKKFSTKIKHQISELDVYVLIIPGGSTVPEVVKQIEKEESISYAEPNFVVSTAATPNDPYWFTSGSWGQSYDDLWGLKKIQADKAWDLSTGSESITVAVIDTGLDFTHEDLQGNFWNNPGEIGDGKENNKIDDDNNGYIDDWRGWDFVNNDNDPTDDYGHGTHVAGTIGAVGNNSVGVVGVNWNIKLMGVKFLNASGRGYDDGASASLIYAANNGARLSNNSWGGYGYSKLISDAIDYAYNKGSTTIAAAGNDDSDARDFTPANHPNAIAVAATDYLDIKASFSNYGPKIDVAAPGVNVLSLKAAGTDMYGDGSRTVGNNYMYASGTSMASPHAAGLAALVLSADPSLTNEQLRQVLRESADDLGDPGKDDIFGYGRINADKALSYPLLAPWIKDRKPGYITSESKPMISAIFTDLIDEKPDTIELKLDNKVINHSYDSISRKISYQVAEALTEGNHTVYLAVEDKSGVQKQTYWSFNVDYYSPTFKNLFPSPGSTVSNASTQISAEVQDSLGFQSAAMYVDGVLVKSFIDYMSNKVLYYTEQALMDGVHTIKLQATDRAGNIGEIDWEFNVAEPPSIISFSPTSWTNNNKPAISSKLYDNTAIDESSIILKLDGEIVSHNFNSLQNEVSYITQEPLTESEHLVEMTVKDSIGLAVTKNWSFSTDYNKPFFENITPAENSTVSTAWPEISLNAYDSLSGINVYSTRMLVDGKQVAFNYDSSNQKIVSDEATLTNGMHNVNVSIYDRAYNQIDASWTFSVDAPFSIGKLSASKLLLEAVSNILSYKVNNTSYVNSSIYDPDNNLVKNLEVNQLHQAGEVSLTWNGKDNFENFVQQSGMYKLKVEAVNLNDETAANEIFFEVITEPLKIISPSNEETLTGKVTLKAMNQTGAGVVSYYYKREGETWWYYIGDSSKAPDYAVIWNTASVQDGTYEVIASTEWPDANSKPIVYKLDNPLTIDYFESSSYFSPNGDGTDDYAFIKALTSRTALADVKIYDENSNIVKALDLQMKTFFEFKWYGKDQNGIDVPDGMYLMRFQAIDNGGKTATRETFINLSREPLQIIEPPSESTISGITNLKASVSPYFPDSYYIYFYYRPIGASEWLYIGRTYNYYNYNLQWNTQAVEDGTYEVKAEMGSEKVYAKAYAMYKIDNSSVPLTINYLYYGDFVSPNGDNISESVDIYGTLSKTATSKLVIYDSNSSIVRSLPSQNGINFRFTWDAKDEIGKIVDDGLYTFSYEAVVNNTNQSVSTTGLINISSEPISMVAPADESALPPTLTLRSNVSPYYNANYASYQYREKGSSSWKAAGFGSSYTKPDFPVFWDTSALPDGTYELQIAAYYYGNYYYIEYSRPINVYKDSIAPTTPTELRVFLINFNEVELSWQASEDSSSGIKEYQIERSTDGNTFTTIGATSETNYTDTSLAEYIYYYRVRAVDKAGNISEPSNIIKVVLDDIAPTTTVQIKGQIGNDSWYTTQPIINLIAVDNEGGSGIKEIKYSANSDDFSIYTGPFVLNNEGNNYVRYYSTDNAGNVEEIKGQLIKVDSAAPGITISNPLEGQSVSGPIEIKAEANDNVAVQKVDFYVDEVLVGEDNTYPYSYLWDTTTTSNGNHTLMSVAYDIAGNNASDQINISVTNAPPNLINNPSFELDDDLNGIPDNWTPIQFTPGDGRSSDFAQEGAYSLKIIGEVAKYKRVTQRINVSGLAGETLFLSGWNKTIAASGTGGCIDVLVYLNNTDGTRSMYSPRYYKNTHDWLYRSKAITPTKNYSSIDVYVVYYLQTGTAYFDNLRLSK